MKWDGKGSSSKRTIQLFGALLFEAVLFPVPHRRFTFGIPKMLRPYFRFNRDLLKDPAWRTSA
ncbi:MAG: hypothetical protein ACUVWY_06015 [Desulfosoma sp.]|uniref:hypothetical protein n=1 Tax=Desulfosoma sp. TaxID=2603217 RepID=UPI00404A8EC2